LDKHGPRPYSAFSRKLPSALRRATGAALVLAGLGSACERPGPPPEEAATAPAACRLEPGADPSAWQLPSRLTEVSGLAVTPDGNLLAHGDEVGRVFEIDPGSRKVAREIRLQGTPRDDFEGIAVTPQGIVLMTSAGRLYVLGAERERDSASGTSVVEYRRLDTGLGALCELEGLAYDSRAKVLLLPCKTPRRSQDRAAVVVFRWSLESEGAAQPPRYVIPSSVVHNLFRVARFRATAAEYDRETGHVLVLSSEPAGVLELGPEGHAVRGVRFSPRYHPRAEGLALLGNQLIIGDEGASRGGHLTAYPCAP